MIQTWVNLQATVNVQRKETELREETIQARVLSASQVEHTGSADYSAGHDEVVDEIVQHAAPVTSLNDYEVTELSTSSDDNDSINGGKSTECCTLEQGYEIGGP
jgi:hypothetical protein